MNLLLDTDVVLWWLGDDRDRISDRAWQALEDVSARFWVSVATLWEAAIQRGMGRLPESAGLPAVIDRSELRLLPITARHADHVATLPHHHADAIDRLLIAQAQLDEMTLVTADPAFRAYAIEVLW